MRNLYRLVLMTILFAPISAFAVDDKVNINKADKFQLSEHLTGVTEEIADNIVTYREKNGTFNKLEEMENVQGIGYDTLNINRNNIVVESAS